MEVVLRALLVFAFAWVVIRVSGKREVAQLSAFDLILLVTIGDLVSDGVLQEDASLTAAMLAVATFALAAMGLGLVSRRFPRVRPVLEGPPRVVIRRGEPLLDVLDGEQLTFDDLVEAAREQGIRRLSDVEVAVLEVNGGFSFFTYPDDGAGDGTHA
ncbi:DUF421 domain-containing protein [Nocardioides solisilvae]|uniref:DUF421 domain-containing protein n=1 Tax=Nocardioides solisilvae TaxID=1542435 RepID=UPI000D7446C6|nr:YetF domain-containing protein [Nocardioides solisilvae]